MFGHALVLSADGSALCSGAPGAGVNFTGACRLFIAGQRPARVGIDLGFDERSERPRRSIGKVRLSVWQRVQASPFSVWRPRDGSNGLALFYSYSAESTNASLLSLAVNGRPDGGMAMSSNGSFAALAIPNGGAISFGIPYPQRMSEKSVDSIFQRLAVTDHFQHRLEDTLLGPRLRLRLRRRLRPELNFRAF